MLRIFSQLSLIALLTLMSPVVKAIEYIGHQLQGNKLTLQTDEQEVVITALSAHAFEVHYQLNKAFPSFAKRADLAAYRSNLQLSENDYALSLSNQNLTLIVNKQALTLSFFRAGQLLTRHHIAAQTRQKLALHFDLDVDEKLLGGGERVLGMDRRGQRLPLYNRAHYGYTTHSEQMNYSLPVVMSSKKYSILFDNSAKGWLDLGKTSANRLSFEAVGGRASFIVTTAHNYPKLIEHYVDITGKQPMPARWVLGNHASRFGYKSQQQVLDTIAKYRELDIPVDSIILDLYWFGKDVQGHMGNLSWDRQAFPEPLQMIEQLREQGVNTTVITEPFVLKNSGKHQQAKQANALSLNAAASAVKYYDFYFGHTALVDIFSQSGQDWFANVYRDLADQGVTGVWGDLGEPEVHPEDLQHQLSSAGLVATADEVHNAYGHTWAQLVYQTLTTHRPNTRPFILMRSGFAGSQRFGLIPWTGDVSRSWGGLKPQVELSLQMGIFGLGYTHSDLGGFAGDNYDREMYIRWLQYGVFQGIYRPHAQELVPPEPVFHDKATQDILRPYIKLRYQLLPYNYTLAYHNSQTGMPLMRPMFFADESQANWIDIADQYMWGDAFLVKPVTEPGVTEQQLILPQGKWFNYWTGEQYQGGQSVSVPVNLEQIPVLVKAGSIIPTITPIASTQDYSSESLKLDYYYHPSLTKGYGDMYEDDGVSANAIAAKQYERLEFKAEQGTKGLFLTLTRDLKGNYQGAPKSRKITLTIHNWAKPSHLIKLQGKSIELVNSASQLGSDKDAAYYHSDEKKLVIHFTWGQPNTQLRIE